MSALALVCCGGGGGEGGQTTKQTTTGTTAGGTGTTGSNSPTAKTIADVNTNLEAYGQSAVSSLFYGFGSEVATLQTPVYQPMLGLWYLLGIQGDHTTKDYFLDQAGTQPAGSLKYVFIDLQFTTEGPISITAGRYAGLSGTYSQALLFGSNGSASGYSGTVTYTIPKIGTTDSQFKTSYGSNGTISGTAVNGVALTSGYTQTEQLVLNADGSIASTSKDTANCTTSFSFAADLSGAGEILGSDPGLPASVVWDNTGTGYVTFKDGTIDNFFFWQIGATPSKATP